MKKNFLVVFLAVIFALFSLEAGCRFYQYFIRHRTIEDTFRNPSFKDYYFLGLSFKPGAGSSWQSIPDLKINNLGFRGEDFKIKKDEGVFRIICFGASTSHAGNYPQKLSRMMNDSKGLPLKKIEVINAAVPTWNSTQSLIQFITRAVYLNPDLVILYDGFNDLWMQDYYWLYHLPEVDYKKYSGFFKNHSVLYNFILTRIAKFKEKIAFAM